MSITEKIKELEKQYYPCKAILHSHGGPDVSAIVVLRGADQDINKYADAFMATAEEVRTSMDEYPDYSIANICDRMKVKGWNLEVLPDRDWTFIGT